MNMFIVNLALSDFCTMFTQGPLMTFNAFVSKSVDLRQINV